MYNNLALVLGHIAGDYFFQSGNMAINKSNEGYKGCWICFKHCIIYSFCVSFFVVMGGWKLGTLTSEFLSINPLMKWIPPIVHSASVVFIIAFITHYHIDRYSLAKYWMGKIGQSDFKNCPLISQGNVKKINYRAMFIAPVYIIIDNGLHLILLWLLLSIIGI